MNQTEQIELLENIEEVFARAEEYRSWWTSPELEGKFHALGTWFHLTNGDLTKNEFGDIMAGVVQAAESGHPRRMLFATGYLNTLTTLSTI